MHYYVNILVIMMYTDDKLRLIFSAEDQEEYGKKFSFERMKPLFESMPTRFNIIGIGGFGNFLLGPIASLLKNLPRDSIQIRYLMFNTARKDVVAAQRLFPPEEFPYLRVIPLGLTPKEIEEYFNAQEIIDMAMRGEMVDEREIQEAKRTIYNLNRKLRGAGGVYDNGIKLFEKTESVITEILSELQPATNFAIAGGGKGTGSSGIYITSRILSSLDKDRKSLILAGIMKPHPSEGIVRMENYRKAIMNTKPYTDLLIEVDSIEIPASLSFEQYNAYIAKKLVLNIDMIIKTQLDIPGTVRSVDQEDLNTTLKERGKSRGIPLLLSSIDKQNNREYSIDELLNVKLVQVIEKSNLVPDSMIMFFDIPKGFRTQDIQGPISKLSEKLGLESLIWGVRERIDGENDVDYSSVIDPPSPREVRVSAIVVQSDIDQQPEHHIAIRTQELFKGIEID